MDDIWQETIAAYRAAYELRHGGRAPELLYRRGWFSFASAPLTRYRRSEINEMRKRLLAQAEKRSAKPNGNGTAG